jgi:hypothetical protein
MLCVCGFLQQFHSKNGPAWLFGQVINVVPGPREERLMTTGMHVVSDISCTKCCALLGWKYVSAADWPHCKLSLTDVEARKTAVNVRVPACACPAVVEFGSMSVCLPRCRTSTFGMPMQQFRSEIAIESVPLISCHASNQIIPHLQTIVCVMPTAGRRS